MQDAAYRKRHTGGKIGGASTTWRATSGKFCNDLYDPTWFTGCDPDNPQGPAVWVNRDTGVKGDGKIHHVTKGGSFLCHVSYCMRHRQ